MSRTTIMADDALLDELRTIAEQEGISLGKVIRQGLEWRARLRQRPAPSFIGAIDSAASQGGPEADDDRIDEYLRAKHPRR